MFRYEYGIRATTNMMLEGGLMGRVRIFLPEPALPIHFHECRDYAGHSGSYSTPMASSRPPIEIFFGKMGP